MNEPKNEAATGRHEEAPSMDAGLFILGGPLVAGAKHLYDARKEALAQVQPSAPLRFAILDSQRHAQGHDLTLLCRNLGVHGVYLERFDGEKLSAGSIHASVLRRSDTIYSTMGTMGVGEPDAPALPVLLPSGETVCVRTRLQALDPERLKKKPYGRLTAYFTVLGVAASGLTAEIEFSLPPWQVV